MLSYCYLYLFTVNWCPTQFSYQMMLFSFHNNTPGVTSRAGISNPPETPEFTTVISRAWLFVFNVVFCRSLFVILSIFLLVNVFSVRNRFTVSDYPFGIFNLFLVLIQTISPYGLLNFQYDIFQGINNNFWNYIRYYFFSKFDGVTSLSTIAITFEFSNCMIFVTEMQFYYESIKK